MATRSATRHALQSIPGPKAKPRDIRRPARGAGSREYWLNPPAADGAAAQAAIDQLHADYVIHFNLHHDSAVAELYGDSAVALGTDGAVEMGKPAIQKGLQRRLAGSPKRMKPW